MGLTQKSLTVLSRHFEVLFSPPPPVCVVPFEPQPFVLFDFKPATNSSVAGGKEGAAKQAYGVQRRRGGDDPGHDERSAAGGGEQMKMGGGAFGQKSD